MKKLDIFYHEKYNYFITFRSHENINLNDGIPKLKIFANHDEWYVEDIEWGITNQVVFQILKAQKWSHFPQIIRSMLFHVAEHTIGTNTLLFEFPAQWDGENKDRKSVV